MLVVNKVAVHVLPAPSFVLFMQLASSALSVYSVGACGLITVDALDTKKVMSFLPVSLAFLGVIYANIKTLQYANVETFIVFRASTPLIISVCDYLFLGRSFPEARSWLALVGLLGGAMGYVQYDASFEVYPSVCSLCPLCFIFNHVYIGERVHVGVCVVLHVLLRSGIHQARRRHCQDGQQLGARVLLQPTGRSSSHANGLRGMVKHTVCIISAYMYVTIYNLLASYRSLCLAQWFGTPEV